MNIVAERQWGGKSHSETSVPSLSTELDRSGHRNSKANKMSAPTGPSIHDDEDDNGEVFLDESDIMHEVAMDDEDLPDADGESDTELAGKKLLLIHLSSNFH